MKKTEKLGVLALSLMLMIAVFAACGGGGASESSDDKAAEKEPNAGFEGIVYTIPDGWTVGDMGEGFINYKIPDTDFSMGVGITTEDNFAEMKNDLPEELKAESLSEFFEKAYKASDESKEKNHLDQSEEKICDSTAYYTKRANESDTGYQSASVAWMHDGSIYELYMFNSKAYDNEGNPVEDAELMHEDMLETFEGVFATVKPGDGLAFASAVEAPNEIGEISFEMPDGYEASGVSENFLNFKKEGSEATIHIYRMTEEEVKTIEQDGKKLTSLEEYFGTGEIADEDKATIAGIEGRIFKHPDEDGKLYHCSAAFMTDQAVYDISIDTDAYDENGLKADAVALTDEDVAAFDAFVQSIKMK